MLVSWSAGEPHPFPSPMRFKFCRRRRKEAARRCLGWQSGQSVFLFESVLQLQPTSYCFQHLSQGVRGRAWPECPSIDVAVCHQQTDDNPAWTSGLTGRGGGAYRYSKVQFKWWSQAVPAGPTCVACDKAPFDTTIFLKKMFPLNGASDRQHDDATCRW